MDKNLLILGAGGYGKTIYELAQSLNCFDKISFLDDNSPLAIGVCADYEKFLPEYQYAYPAFGDNNLRFMWINLLTSAMFNVPSFVHPLAFVSSSATLSAGSVVLAMGAVGAACKIETGAIINMGAIVDHDCTIKKCAHLAPSVVVKAGNTINEFEKLESGTVVLRK